MNKHLMKLIEMLFFFICLVYLLLILWLVCEEMPHAKPDKYMVFMYVLRIDVVMIVCFSVF